MVNVIVFGPTGNVGSITAVAAQQYGAKVFLAMRDPSKPISGITPEQEAAGGFTRVKADLLQPDTVAEAVKSTGATRAFVYAAHGSPDHMRATAEAMKASGIEFIVYLSSFTIRDRPLASIPEDEIISYIHAQHELSLDAVFGADNYIAIRAGGFATNLLRYRDGIIAGEVKIHGGNFTMDCITPQDMGGVAGSALANGRKGSQSKMFLYGPQERTEKECIGVIGEVLDKDIKISGMSAETATQLMLDAGLPRPIAEWLVKIQGSELNLDDWARVDYEQGVKNVELYTGKPAMGFKEWLTLNKQLFSA